MRVKGDEHYVNMKREKSKEREKEKYFLRCARSLLSSVSVSSSFPPNRFAGFAGNLRCQQNKPLIMQSNAHDKGRLCFYR